MNYEPLHWGLCNLEVTKIYLHLSSMFLYASGTHLKQAPHIFLDLLGAYKNIVLMVFYPFSNFYVTYEK